MTDKGVLYLERIPPRHALFLRTVVIQMGAGGYEKSCSFSYWCLSVMVDVHLPLIRAWPAGLLEVVGRVNTSVATEGRHPLYPCSSRSDA